MLEYEILTCFGGGEFRLRYHGSMRPQLLQDAWEYCKGCCGKVLVIIVWYSISMAYLVIVGNVYIIVGCGGLSLRLLENGHEVPQASSGSGFEAFEVDGLR